MANEKRTDPNGTRTFIYYGKLPPLLLLLLIAPLLLVFLSFAAVALVGGSIAALVLPWFFRSRLRATHADSESITLDPDQYSRVESDAPRLPPH